MEQRGKSEKVVQSVPGDENRTFAIGKEVLMEELCT